MPITSLGRRGDSCHSTSTWSSSKRSKRKRELERILDQYDLDHAEQGGLAGIALELFKKAEHGRMIAGEIAEILFSDLPAKDRHAIGDMLDRDLIGKGRGWLRPLVTGGHLTQVLKPH
jgi:hypothetical protein